MRCPSCRNSIPVKVAPAPKAAVAPQGPPKVASGTVIEPSPVPAAVAPPTAPPAGAAEADGPGDAPVVGAPGFRRRDAVIAAGLVGLASLALATVMLRPATVPGAPTPRPAAPAVAHTLPPFLKRSPIAPPPAQGPAAAARPNAPAPASPADTPAPPAPDPTVAAAKPGPTPTPTPEPAPPADRLETVRRIKDATVYLKVGQGPATASGSGFVVKAEDGVIYVATNHHVVEPPDAPRRRRGDDPGDDVPPWPPITAVFRSGDPTGRETSHPARVVAHDRQGARDLAILAVEDVPDPPMPIDVSRPAEVVETTPLYIHGFPFGDLDRLVDRNTRRNPSISISGGRVSSLRRGDDGRVALVQVDGALNPGNSGGPVVDEEGRLVGVAVSKLADANIGFAVPAAELVRMMQGRVGRIRVQTRPTAEGEFDLDVRASLIDPFGRIRSVEILRGPDPGRTDPGESGWPELENSRRTALVLRPGSAEGTVHVYADVGMGVTLQAVVKDEADRTWAEKPFSHVVPPNAGVIAVGGGGAADRAGDVAEPATLVDPSRACKLKRDGPAVTIRIPPGVFALGADFAARPAPMSLTEVEGDFDLRVRVDGSLLPGFDPPRHKGRTLPNTYQGAGLVLYADRGNYVRFERGTVGQRSRPDVTSEVIAEICHNGRSEPTLTQVVPEGPISLRILRVDGVVRCLVGNGGDAWLPSRQLAVRFPEKVRVGLIATNLSREENVARFLEPALTVGRPGGE